MEDGALSLICVGTAFAQFIFLFDVLALTRYDLQPLLSFLGSKVMKVVWDGRMDFIELWSTFNVSIGKNVCDLQVAEVLSRSSFRGERDDERLSRLVTYFGPQVWNDPLQFAGIHRVVGLQKCLEENGYRGLVGKDREYLFLAGCHFFPGSCAYAGTRLLFSRSNDDAPSERFKSVAHQAPSMEPPSLRRSRHLPYRPFI